MAVIILVLLLMICPVNAIGAGFTDAPGGELTSANITAGTMFPAQKSSTGYYIEMDDLRDWLIPNFYDTTNMTSDYLSLNTNEPRKWGFADGASASAVTDDEPTMSFYRFDGTSLTAAGATVSYLFTTIVQSGDQAMRASLMGYAQGDVDDWDCDVVGTAGYGWSSAANKAWGMFGDSTLWDADGRATGAEYNVRNATNAPAVNPTNADQIAGTTQGAWIVGYTLGTSTYNSVGLLIDAGNADSSFYKGIVFTGDAVKDYAIDMNEIGSTPVSIRLPNNNYVKARDSGNTADISLFKANAAGELEFAPTLRTNVAAIPLIMRESDSTLPAGLWRIVTDFNAWRIDMNTDATGAFGTVITPFGIDYQGDVGFGTSYSLDNDERVEIEQVKTITGGVTDGYSAGLRIDPGYTAASALTVTRHNYIDLQDVSVAGAGPAAVTDSAVFRFDANIGTHKAVRTSGSVDSYTWDGFLKINVNGTLYYIPFCAAGDIS